MAFILLQDKVVQQSQNEVKDKVQIIFCSTQHLIGLLHPLQAGEVKIYNLLYRTVEKETKKIIQSLFVSH